MNTERILENIKINEIEITGTNGGVNDPMNAKVFIFRIGNYLEECSMSDLKWLRYELYEKFNSYMDEIISKSIKLPLSKLNIEYINFDNELIEKITLVENEKENVVTFKRNISYLVNKTASGGEDFLDLPRIISEIGIGLITGVLFDFIKLKAKDIKELISKKRIRKIAKNIVEDRLKRFYYSLNYYQNTIEVGELSTDKLVVWAIMESKNKRKMQKWIIETITNRVYDDLVNK